MILAIFGGMLLTAIVAFFGGLFVGVGSQMKSKLRELGFTPNSAKLYSRAAKILNRMVKVTELDGDFAADILSEETKRQVNDWLADYKKEINKV